MQENSTALRHTPKQLRGQRKVDHILRVAEALFAEAGFENVTTNAVAARAGISIGSLYQFFSGKDAILEAIADRYIEQTRAALGKQFSATEDLELEPFMHNMLELVIKQQEQRPYFLQCLATTRPSLALSKRMDQLMEEYASLLVTRWLNRGVLESANVMKLKARVTVRTMTGLLPLAMDARGRERAVIVEEIHQVLVNYLAPTVKRRRV